MLTRVLGPVEVWRDDTRVVLPGGRPTTLLLRLLVDRGRVVSVDAIAEALWSDARPVKVNGTVQLYVSHLRRALGADAVVTRPPGYAAGPAVLDFDHVHLEEHLGRARELRLAGRALDAAAEAERAVGLVRGAPYVDVQYEDWAQVEIARLQALELAAHGELHAARLEAGLHHESVPALSALVAAHPLDEGLRALLMLALYRDGRQADALRCYAEGRERLVDELGVEPGPELRQLEARVLAQDPALDLTVRAEHAERGAGDGGRGRMPAVELVGRGEVTGTLWRAWEDARSTGHRMVLVEGDPGMGKTALVRWLRAAVEDHGAVVGVGTASELDGAPSYLPWSLALQDLAAGPHAEQVAALLPTSPAVAALASRRVESRQFELFDELAVFLGRLAATAPVVILLDDLHWADDGTAQLLRFLARASSSAPLLVVAAHRPVPTDHPLAAAIGAVAGESAVSRVRLDPLAVDEVGELVDRLTGGRVERVDRADRVDRAVVASIATATGGNPFFVREVVRVLSAGGGGLDLSRATVPDTVRASLRARAEALGTGAVDVLTVAACSAGDIDDEIVAEVLGTAVDAVGRILDAAARDGLVVEAPRVAGTYRFGHDLVRHAFADAVSQRRRATIHLAIARALVARLPSRPSETQRGAAEIAAHFSQAIDAGGADEAVRWLRAGAAEAARADAHRDAQHHLRRALFVVRSRLPDDRLECEVLLELAAASRLAADPATMRLAQERAHRLAVRLGDEALAVRARELLLGPGRAWLRPR